ncbi:apolipoprotein N-acyltransferase [Alteromonas hispanica]|uniref:Apolipoprotein N-acyltransferase n=1 Tax=Alteromonas hispanica TaxID=315421 RepID=A0A6L9MQY1_9ALTE|nr:apolipoprotein N-acyltransferase [Alteromonas hispanica]NDW20477.1 apolipoprotein N-acyltransferase [Alteromonas hispanica]
MLKRFTPYLLLIASGLSLTLAFAPFSMWALTIPALAIAIRQLIKLKHKPFLAGWLFGMGWFGAGVSWVHVSIADFGGLPLIASIGLMALLCGYLALYPALAFKLAAKYFKPQLWPLALPLFWVLAEWLRSWMLSGFPWLSLGYSQINGPLAGFAPIIGETGLTALLVISAASLAIINSKRTFLSASAITASLLICGALLYQHTWVSPSKTYSVSMVQGNIPQSLRWVPEQDAATMQTYLELTETVWSSDLIIWPEAAVPKLEPLAQPYLSQLNERAFNENTALITGIVNFNWETDEAWNNLIVVGKKTPDATYPNYHYFHNNRFSKHHLLPVGEFVPFESLLRPLAPIFDLPMSSFSRGDFQQQNLEANGIKLAPAICFEIAFPRQVTANVNGDTDMIITVSNDAWFGKSHGPAQHLQIAQMRALELGRPVLRATNNGITAFIDHKGRIDARLPQFESANISAPVIATKGFTPYYHLQDYGVWLFVLVLFICAWRLKKAAD